MKNTLLILTLITLLFPVSSLAAIDRSFTVWVTQPSPMVTRELKVGLEASYRSLRPEVETVLVRLVKQAEKSEAGSEIRKRKYYEGKT